MPVIWMAIGIRTDSRSKGKESCCVEATAGVAGECVGMCFMEFDCCREGKVSSPVLLRSQAVAWQRIMTDLAELFQIPKPRFRPKLQSIPPLSRATPLMCLPRCCSSTGCQGTSWKPKPPLPMTVSIMAKRPLARLVFPNSVPLTYSPERDGTKVMQRFAASSCPMRVTSDFSRLAMRLLDVRI